MMVEPNPAIPPQRPPDEDDAGVPVFRPTAADFGDFAAFIARVEPECAKFGCFKVSTRISIANLGLMQLHCR